MLGRKERKKTQKGKTAPDGVITVLPPIQEPAVNLDSIAPLALITHLLGWEESDQLMDTANSLFWQLHVAIQNVAAGRGVRGNHCGLQGW